MAQIEDVKTASQVAEKNGAMSYDEWRRMHMYPAQKTGIGAVAGLVGGGLLALAFPAYAVALAVGGTVVGAVGGFVQASTSALSPKMVSSYISYVDRSNEMVEKTKPRNQARTVPEVMIDDLAKTFEMDKKPRVTDLSRTHWQDTVDGRGADRSWSTGK